MLKLWTFCLPQRVYKYFTTFLVLASVFEQSSRVLFYFFSRVAIKVPEREVTTGQCNSTTGLGGREALLRAWGKFLRWSAKIFYGIHVT